MTLRQRVAWLEHRAAELERVSYLLNRRSDQMSIQIAGGSHPAARAEVAVRIGDLSSLIAAYYASSTADDETRRRAQADVLAVLRGFFFALIGSMPDEGEVEIMIGKRR